MNSALCWGVVQPDTESSNRIRANRAVNTRHYHEEGTRGQWRSAQHVSHNASAAESNYAQPSRLHPAFLSGSRVCCREQGGKGRDGGRVAIIERGTGAAPATSQDANKLSDFARSRNNGVGHFVVAPTDILLHNASQGLEGRRFTIANNLPFAQVACLGPRVTRLALFVFSFLVLFSEPVAIPVVLEAAHRREA